MLEPSWGCFIIFMDLLRLDHPAASSFENGALLTFHHLHRNALQLFGSWFKSLLSNVRLQFTAVSFQLTDSRSFHIFPASYLYITPRYLCKSLHVVRKNRLNLKGAVCAWPVPCFMRSVRCAIRSSLAMAQRCGQSRSSPMV